MKEVHPLLRTAAVSTIRRFLIERQYTELALPATTQYRIDGVKAFKLGPKAHLRYTAEPDIWLAGEGFEQFFWVGSVFRNEKNDPLSGNEFTMAAVYAKHHTTTQMVSLLFQLLRELEQSISMPYLTREPLRYATYKEFSSKSFDRKQDGWVVVTEMPKEKSFYDQESALGNTMRFTAYFLRGGKAIEMASGGTVGENQNRKMRINNHHVPKDIYNERLIGLRLGVERLLLVYDSHESRK